MGITHHAYERAKERLGFTHKAFEKIVKRSIERGVSHRETKGSFRGYLDSIFMKSRLKEIRIYGEHMFLFGNNDSVVTVFKVPNRFRKYILKLQHHDNT